MFDVFRVSPILGGIKRGEVVLDYPTWQNLFHRDGRAIGSYMVIGNKARRISAVLPRSFQFISRQPALYLMDEWMADPRVLVIARIKRGVDPAKLRRELVRITEEDNYYFFSSTLRMTPVREILFTPLRSFGIAVAVALLLALAVSGIRLRQARAALRPRHRGDTLRRAGFLAGKLSLALLAIFIAGIEWTRPSSSILLPWADSGSGPFLIWFNVGASMAIFFWAIGDQRARCRVCLRLLAFPVRMGCPGCLLLTWSGTELLCSEGHGVLHVPHLATSWDDKSDRWVEMDESWRGLFVER